MTFNKVQNKILVASAAAYCIANIGWWVQPSLIYEVIVRYRVRESEAGLVASAEMTAIALGSVLFAKLITKIPLLQIALVGAVVALIGAALSIVVQDYNFLLMSRSVTGLGEGAMLAVASASLASFKDPDKAYGKINIVAILFGSAAVFSLPITAKYFSIEHNVFPTIFVGIAILSLLIPFMPKDLNHDEGHLSSAPVAHDVLSWKLLSLIIGVFIVSVTTGAMWSFYYLLGDRAGLNEEQIHNAVAIAALISVFGALLATLIGAKFGRFLPITLGIIVLTIAIAAMSHSHHPLVFRIGAVLIVAGTYFLVPYFLGYAAAQDPSGRDAAIVAGSFLLTGAVGPYLGGFIIETFGVGSIAMIVICTNLIAWLSFFVVDRGQKTNSSAPTPLHR